MKYTNPILYGDFSDPDVIRVGVDFYMVSSSFTYLPGLPVLHSRDLVHWELLGYAAARLPFERYDRPCHRCGTWAPSIRHHNGLFYVYVCLPDEGLFAFTAQDPAGEWECHHVHDVCGWIDPCPLFDDDGRAYLVHGFAASRCGINNILYLHEMSPDGLKILDKGRLIYSGAEHGDVTVEGPKIYKRQGQYWILCPAGGVTEGYQLALRADGVGGPYARRVCLAQGSTDVNGPHQGGWVDDGRGGDWFIHFQDKGPYGRVTHLQRVDWSDGWPLMGNGGEPETGGDTGLEPFEGKLRMSDDFRTGLGLQWQWQANPNRAWYTETRPGVRLYAQPSDDLFHAGQFLSQNMLAYRFDMEARFELHDQSGDVCGMGMMGYTYHYIALRDGRVALVEGQAQPVNRWHPEKVTERTLAAIPWEGRQVIFRMRAVDGMVCFFCRYPSREWMAVGEKYPMTCGGWTGARPGIFCMNQEGHSGGWADVPHVYVYPR